MEHVALMCDQAVTSQHLKIVPNSHPFHIDEWHLVVDTWQVKPSRRGRFQQRQVSQVGLHQRAFALFHTHGGGEGREVQHDPVPGALISVAVGPRPGARLIGPRPGGADLDESGLSQAPPH